jgi:hypothetical protein
MTRGKKRRFQLSLHSIGVIGILRFDDLMTCYIRAISRLHGKYTLVDDVAMLPIMPIFVSAHRHTFARKHMIVIVAFENLPLAH